MVHPTTAMARKIFRHMRRTLRKIVASSPTSVIKSCSFVTRIGFTQASMPFPSAGGACLSSATLSFGAYTRELYGRKRENMMARTSVMSTEVPKLASKPVCWSCSQVSDEPHISRVNKSSPGHRTDPLASSGALALHCSAAGRGLPQASRPSRGRVATRSQAQELFPNHWLVDKANSIARSPFVGGGQTGRQPQGGQDVTSEDGGRDSRFKRTGEEDDETNTSQKKNKEQRNE